MLIKTNARLRRMQLCSAYQNVIKLLRGDIGEYSFAKRCKLDPSVFKKKDVCPNLTTIASICSYKDITFEEFGKMIDEQLS